MTYETSKSFCGDTKKVLTAAAPIFMTNGFRVEQVSTSEIMATGPGMSSTRQNPLWGVRPATLHFGGFNVRFSAEPGGVRTMRNFLFLFPPGLALALMLTFYLAGMWPTQVAGTVLAAISLWIVIAPLIAIKTKKKTIEAIESLTHSIAHAA